jgi:hypothetical protein
MNGGIVQWEMGREKTTAQGLARKRRLEKRGLTPLPAAIQTRIDPPPTAIQPGPIAISSSQYKSVQVNLTK